MMGSITRGIDVVRSLAEHQLSKGDGNATFMDICTIDVNSNELCRAVSLGAVRLVRTLLQGGIDIGATNDDQQTALHVFCIRRDVHSDEDRHILKLLFEYRVNGNARDRWGKTALIYAAGLRKSSALMERILREKVDIFIEDHIGFSALTYAYNAHDEPTIKLLIDRCNEEGREMVVLETQLSANFLSYLKIQKLVGAEQASVRMNKKSGGSSSPRGAQTSTAANLANFVIGGSQTPSARRLSQALGGKFINLLSASRSTNLAPAPINATARRRRSSIAACKSSSALQSCRPTIPVAQLGAPIDAKNIRRHSLLLLSNDKPSSATPDTPLSSAGASESNIMVSEGDSVCILRCTSCGTQYDKVDKATECNITTPRNEGSLPVLNVQEENM